MRRALLAIGLLWACGDDNPATPPTCGDGTVDDSLAEECDDGNAELDDGCEACKVVPIPTAQWQANAVIRGTTDPFRTAITPKSVAVDSTGNVYLSDNYRHRVYKVDVGGSITVVAGDGVARYNGDGVAGRTASLNRPIGVAVDHAGNLYIADAGNNRIRKVDTAGTITTIAGNGTDGYSGDDGVATDGMLQFPNGVAVGSDGTVYFSDTNNNRVRSVDPSGVMHTVAGNGTDGFSDGPATSSMVWAPIGLAIDTDDTLYIADSANGRVRKLSNGTLSTIAGTGVVGNSGDGGPATSAQLATPAAVAAVNGVVYIADADSFVIRKVEGGTISTIAGTGTDGFSGDGAAASGAKLNLPQGVALDATGQLYIADTANFRVRRIDAAGTIGTIAGSGEYDDVGDHGGPTSATMQFPRGVTLTSTGDLYIADTDHNRVRKLAADGTLSTIAGTGEPGTGGDMGPATAAQVSGPIAVAVDVAGNKIYIVEPTRIRKIGPNGNISTIATGLSFASGIAVTTAGDVYFTDRDANVIKKIAAAGGAPTTICGDGTGAFSGDNGPALAAQVKAPMGITADGNDLYVADSGNRRVRKIDAGGTITTVAGNGTVIIGNGPSGDGAAALDASVYPFAVAVAGGAVYVADGLQYRIRKFTVGGNIATIAGTGTAGELGDGGPAVAAKIGLTYGIAADAAGNAYFVDNDANKIRKVDTAGTLTAVVGQVDPPGGGPLATAALADPRAMAVVGDTLLVAGGTFGVVEAVRGTALEVVAGRYGQDGPTSNLARYRDRTIGAITGIAYDDAAKIVYVTETTANRILAITLVDPADPKTWTIAPFANTAGTSGMADGPIATATFRSPSGLYLDVAGHRMLVADTQNHAIRSIDMTSMMVSTIAGTPMTMGFGGDGGPATAAMFDTPRALTMCANGDIFVADTNNHRIRRIAGGNVSTVLGNGEATTMGEGTPATSIPAFAPRGVACDAANNVYVTTTQTVRYLPAVAGIVDGTGEVQTIFGRKRAMFPGSTSSCLAGITAGTGVEGNTGVMLRVVDMCAGTLVELRP